MQANLEDSTGGSVNRKLSNSGGRGVLVAVVVWRADLYQKETLKLLSNSCFHGKVDKDLIALLQIYSPTDAAPQFL